MLKGKMEGKGATVCILSVLPPACLRFYLFIFLLSGLEKLAICPHFFRQVSMSEKNLNASRTKTVAQTT
jgi:hypothetical protein